ncbi:MAG: trypsin-like peptidase domain-containing protein [Bacteroidetes bacterium]|nr:trypsin-like peptidase domain-containing protein [Bacteroidota bacterium]
MKISNNVKTIGLGLLGGLLPLAMYWALLDGNSNTITDQNLNSSKNSYAQSVNYNGLPPGSEDFVLASESSLNSVVHVTTKVVKTTFQRDIFSEFFYGPGAGGKEYKQFGQGSGSGVIISGDGYIVTNNHVIDEASEIEVILNDNSKYTAKIVGTDPSTDLAVLKIEAKNLQAIPMGNSDNIRVGEWVLAVGNPFNLTSTVTAGIVSAKARNINLLADRSRTDIVPIESFIQTDAAVNPGNSGGALVNTKGELVGINTAIASQTGSYSGYSFAVPANLVQKVMKDLMDYGIVQRGYLGIQIADISQEIKEKNKLPNTKGVFLSKVTEGGSADKAGIKDESVILKIGNKEVNSVAALQEEIGRRRPGDKVNITLREPNGSETIKEVVLRNAEGETKLVTKEEIAKNVSLGATFEALSSKEKKELNINSGVRIKTLNAGKLKSVGLIEGCIITKINNESIETIEQLTNKLNNTRGGVLIEFVTPSGRKDYIGLGL